MTDSRNRESSRRATGLVTDEQLKHILRGATQNAIEELDTTAEHIGKALADLKFTTSQIRAVFGKVRSIEQIMTIDADTASQSDATLPTTISLRASQELRLLRPKLAYQYGKISGDESKNPQKIAMGILQAILSNAIIIVGNERMAFERFVHFFEAILAYHRANIKSIKEL